MTTASRHNHAPLDTWNNKDLSTEYLQDFAERRLKIVQAKLAKQALAGVEIA